MRGLEVLDVEEVDPLPEDLRLMVLLDAEALARVAPAEALFQQVQDRFAGQSGVVSLTQRSSGPIGIQGRSPFAFPRGPAGSGKYGGEGGIRTLETVARLHAFQACAFDHSATSPLRKRRTIAERPSTSSKLGHAPAEFTRS